MVFKERITAIITSLFRFLNWWVSSWSLSGFALGLLTAGLAFSPTLIPRPYGVQGVLAGIAFSLGYGFGRLGYRLWIYLQLPLIPKKYRRKVEVLLFLGILAFVWYFMSNSILWDRSLRELMEMPVQETYHYGSIVLIALVVAVVIITIVRLLVWGLMSTGRLIHRFIPRRISGVIGALFFLLLLNGFVQRTIVSTGIEFADALYATLDTEDPEGISQPAETTRSGSQNSLISWDQLGRTGKKFVSQGPRKAEIEAFYGQEAEEPIRVYVGMKSAETSAQQAALALEELKRVNAFEREVVVIATPTGTGWIDPAATNSLEYLLGGDTAIVGMQYSYLQSPLALILQPGKSAENARALFDVIYDHWVSLPEEERPKLFLTGVSLGSYASERSIPVDMLANEPINGAVWAGPPFRNILWKAIQENRNEGSPAWKPKFGDGSFFRVMGFSDTFAEYQSEWGEVRVVYIVYPSDAIVFFQEDMWYQKPDWLNGERGEGISDLFSWYPIITFLQVAADMLISQKVTMGYGHNYSPYSYADAWVSVLDLDTDPTQLDLLKDVLLSRMEQEG